MLRRVARGWMARAARRTHAAVRAVCLRCFVCLLRAVERMVWAGPRVVWCVLRAAGVEHA
jgi:hypothetical protein